MTDINKLISEVKDACEEVYKFSGNDSSLFWNALKIELRHRDIKNCRHVRTYLSYEEERVIAGYMRVVVEESLCVDRDSLDSMQENMLRDGIKHGLRVILNDDEILFEDTEV